jgi:hypothetical protein
MRTMNRRITSPIAPIAMALVLAGCSGDFITRVMGSDGTVSFHFYLSENDPPAELTIIHFVVQQEIGEDNWLTVWELKGKQATASVTYGSKYAGLSEVAPAKPLSRGSRYRALVREQGWLRPISYSGVYFLLDERGSPVSLTPN